LQGFVLNPNNPNECLPGVCFDDTQCREGTFAGVCNKETNMCECPNGAVLHFNPAFANQCFAGACFFDTDCENGRCMDANPRTPISLAPPVVAGVCSCNDGFVLNVRNPDLNQCIRGDCIFDNQCMDGTCNNNRCVCNDGFVKNPRVPTRCEPGVCFDDGQCTNGVCIDENLALTPPEAGICDCTPPLQLSPIDPTRCILITN